MSDAYTELDRGQDAYGIHWAVGTEDGALVVCAGSTLLTLDGDRERFAEAVARAVTPGQVPSRVKHGPWCGCTPCKAEPSYAERRAEAHAAVSG